MHFVANLATVMFYDEGNLQLEYSPTYTALSFFVPIFVLLPAFYVAGGAGDGKAGLVRVVSGGVLSGARYVVVSWREALEIMFGGSSV